MNREPIAFIDFTTINQLEPDEIQIRDIDAEIEIIQYFAEIFRNAINGILLLTAFSLIYIALTHQIKGKAKSIRNS